MNTFGADVVSIFSSVRDAWMGPKIGSIRARGLSTEAEEIANGALSQHVSPGRNSIIVSDVYRDYPNSEGSFTHALQDINFNVNDGEFVCIVGPSGCGKSTLLHLVAGLDRPTAGEIRVGGELIHGPGTDRILIFQELGLFPWLTVQQNVEFGLRMSGVPRSERRDRAMSYLRMVHLSQFKDHYIHQLSGGMKQRVALARSLALRPRILLMDEPFAALDAQTRDMLHDELERLWIETSSTIVFVTHNVREAVRLADRVLLMSFRPGHLKAQFEISLPRPRHIEDADVAHLSKTILGQLREEITRSVLAEYSDEESA
jgi:NitT/TauT family transport system ATP-binding protein